MTPKQSFWVWLFISHILILVAAFTKSVILIFGCFVFAFVCWLLSIYYGVVGNYFDNGGGG